MAICVEIEVDDQGQVTVGVSPPGQESSAPDQQEDKSYMQPAKSVQDALQTANDLLTNPQAQQAAAAPDQAMPQDAQAAAAQSFNAIRGGG